MFKVKDDINLRALIRETLRSKIAELEHKVLQNHGQSKRLSDAVREVSRVNAELTDGIRNLTENGSEDS